MSTTKKSIQDKVDEVIAWLDDNGSAEQDEFEAKKKDIEAVCQPIMAKIHATTDDAPSDTGGPQVEEVD